MEAATLIPRISLSPCMKFDMNWGPLSLITSYGSPCSFQTLSRNNRATPSEDGGGDEVGLLGQAIHSEEYGIIAMTLGEFRDQVDRDNLPPTVWIRFGISFPAGLVGNVFVRLQRSQALHILSDITSHARPPVVTCYQLGRLPPS